jgi:hypothetical protein
LKKYRIIMDIDGVVADCRHRLPLIGVNGWKVAGKKCWDDFYAECVNDAPLQSGLDLAETFCSAGLISTDYPYRVPLR